ncbi:uncharacterized protein LOC126570292 [Anopheles aquasalis]|uniref:uncharacterized protein LOC126570292 n=1 Tax=Anopheles aquasalis TaxID=42839 RepID=UPI00215A1CDB|nr:uncharacterized protein LOC126570292 [Anopheles aquasalis]
MSKSPGSVVSSDETQSVSDESLVVSAANSHTSLRSIGIVKGPRKSSKDVEQITTSATQKERPPWRPASLTAVPVPPPPKPDIKARFLEASKRMRRVNATVQTDPVHTKLMKEASTDEQTDLVPMVDEEILTDGNLVMREIGNLILTHSVAQMTEGVETCDSGTQTAIPRSGISFRKFLDPLTGNEQQQGSVASQGTATAGPSSLLSKILPKPLDADVLEESEAAGEEEPLIKSFFMASPVAGGSRPLAGDTAQEELVCSSHGSSDSVKEANTPDLISATVEGDPSPHRGQLLETPTFAAWHDLDFSDEDSEQYVGRELPRRSIGEGERPWAEFKDLVIGSRVANMRLSPIPPRRPRAPNQKTVTWSDRQHRAVSRLLDEASALVDMFDHVSLLLGPDIELHKLPPQQEFSLPPPKWEPLLVKSCDLLEEKLAQVRHLSLSDLGTSKAGSTMASSCPSPMLCDVGPEKI